MSGWLEVHLILGLIGPTAILYHSGFEFGSLNATIAMTCMLAVAGSGVGGRFVYGRLHRGLAGPRRTVDSLRRDARSLLEPISGLIDDTPLAHRAIERFDRRVFAPSSGWLRVSRIFWLRPYARIERHRTARALWRRRDVKLRRRPVRRVLRQHFAAKCRAVELHAYERVFALWHAVHVPLCVILFVSAAIHVVAVHLY
jgi:hypothetical protein